MSWKDSDTAMTLVFLCIVLSMAVMCRVSLYFACEGEPDQLGKYERAVLNWFGQELRTCWDLIYWR